MIFNKVLSVNDYQELIGHEPPINRKEWEVQMALRTLVDLKAAKASAEILGAGAGHEPTIYLLSQQVKRVFATDVYLAPGMWAETRRLRCYGIRANWRRLASRTTWSGLCPNTWTCAICVIRMTRSMASSLRGASSTWGRSTTWRRQRLNWAEC